MVFPSVVHKSRRIKPIKLQCWRVWAFDKVKRMGEDTQRRVGRREVGIETENGQGRWLTKSLSNKNHIERSKEKSQVLSEASLNNGSAYLVTVGRSNENFANVQQFKVEVNLGPHSFSSDSEGQADLSTCKINSLLVRQYFISPNHRRFITNVKRELLKYSPGLLCTEGTRI